jgi:predicted nuclease of predicted toxin-antitoxin system
MRFLADAGVSPKTVEFLITLGHEAVHVRTRGLQRTPDREIIQRGTGRFQRILVDHEFADAQKGTVGKIRVGSPTGDSSYLARVLT